MKFATAQAGCRGSPEAHLLQAMLHNFRRIHAAKRSFCDHTETAFVTYRKLIQRLEHHSVASVRIVACCTYAAAKAQHNFEARPGTKKGVRFRRRPRK
jgi:RNase P subunit RPR2